MAYFKTDIRFGKYRDEEEVLDELLLHNDIFSQICFGNIIDKEKMFIERGWLPKDFDFKKFYHQKII